MNEGEREKRFRNKTKGIWKSSIKDGIDFIYWQIEKVNLDTMWAHLLCWYMIIKGVFANRSHRNLTKGVKFFKTDMSSCIDFEKYLRCHLFPKISCNSNKIKTYILKLTWVGLMVRNNNQAFMHFYQASLGFKSPVILDIRSQVKFGY